MSLMDAYIVASGMRQSHDADMKNLDIIMQAGIARITDLENQVRKLQEALAVEQCHTAGLEAQRDAFMAQHPDSPLMVDSGKRFVREDLRGRIKTKVRLIYEATFDAMAKKANIKDPESVRSH